MADISANIATAIKRRRTQLNMSLVEVAQMAGTSKSHIWALEQGRTGNPTLGMAMSLCSALSMSLNDLVGVDVSQPTFTEREMALIAAHRQIFGGGLG